jgi:hypothetical protein
MIRTVRCERGPMDGAEIAIPAATQLPETISFPGPVMLRRDFYRLVEESEELARYEFERSATVVT